MNVAFVGHGFHLKYTKSTQFLIDILQQTWPRLSVFSEEWSWARLPAGRRWDLVVFFQQMPSRLLLDSVDIGHVVLVPMYDDCSHEKVYWEAYKDCSILCFSKTFATLLKGWDHHTLEVQYYPPVPERPADWSGGLRKAFFWPRKANLGWPIVKHLLEGWEWQGVHLHVAQAQPELMAGVTDEDLRKFSVSKTSWFVNRQEMFSVLGSCQVYFAPRRTEGIGMSFLEAMALGLAVVAPNGATMNEYIQSGVNGYLYEPDSVSPPDWAQAPSWGARARQDAVAGRARWLASIGSLVEFLACPGPTRKPSAWTSESSGARKPVAFRYAFYLVLEPLRALKRWVQSRFEERR